MAAAVPAQTRPASAALYVGDLHPSVHTHTGLFCPSTFFLPILSDPKQ